MSLNLSFADSFIDLYIYIYIYIVIHEIKVDCHDCFTYGIFVYDVVHVSILLKCLQHYTDACEIVYVKATNVVSIVKRLFEIKK